MKNNLDLPCACLQQGEVIRSYRQCCYPLHQKQTKAKSALTLMRSRYSAFVYQEYQYLIDTHHPDFRHGLTIEQLTQESNIQWIALQLIEHKINSQVTFQAWFRLDGKLDAIHERSQFKQVADHWYYTQGEQLATIFPKRSALCLCHSGKKFKRCCGAS